MRFSSKPSILPSCSILHIGGSEEVKLKEELWHLEQQLSEMERAKPESPDIQEPELAKLAQIPMNKAIQIATAQPAGTVLECRLRGARKEDREYVMCGVLILSAKGAESTVTRVAISAIEGRIHGWPKGKLLKVSFR
jgi:hypothetical protein